MGNYIPEPYCKNVATQLIAECMAEVARYGNLYPRLEKALDAVNNLPDTPKCIGDGCANDCCRADDSTPTELVSTESIITNLANQIAMTDAWHKAHRLDPLLRQFADAIKAEIRKENITTPEVQKFDSIQLPRDVAERIYTEYREVYYRNVFHVSEDDKKIRHADMLALGKALMAAPEPTSNA